MGSAPKRACRVNYTLEEVQEMFELEDEDPEDTEGMLSGEESHLDRQLENYSQIPR